jgi:transcriptional regulator with XRE-family HTH domain
VTHPFGELSAQRKHLGEALRRLRRTAALSGEQIAARVGLSQSQVSRIEIGQQPASPEVAERWAQATGASQDAVGEVIELAETVATQAISWRQAMRRGLGRLQQDTRDMEATAGTILNFQTLGIPGLLQVPEYARRLIAAGYPKPTPEDVATVSALGNVTVGIIPLGTEVDACCDHGFNIYDDRGDAGGPVVHVETLTSAVNVEDPEDVGAYRDVFSHLRAAAVTGDDARHLIEEAARSL